VEMARGGVDDALQRRGEELPISLKALAHGWKGSKANLQGVKRSRDGTSFLVAHER